MRRGITDGELSYFIIGMIGDSNGEVCEVFGCLLRITGDPLGGLNDGVNGKA